MEPGDLFGRLNLTQRQCAADDKTLWITEITLTDRLTLCSCLAAE
jgi:hypothetical protein